MHVPRLVLCIDQVKGYAHRFTVGQTVAGVFLQNVQRPLPQRSLFGVEMPHIVGQGHVQNGAAAQPLQRKVQMVCQGEGQVGVELALQLHLCLLRNVGAGFQHRIGDAGRHLHIPRVHIIKGPLNLGIIAQFVGHVRKTNSFAQNHYFGAAAVQPQRCVIVYFFDNTHVGPCSLLDPASGQKKSPQTLQDTPSPLHGSRSQCTSSASGE